MHVAALQDKVAVLTCNIVSNNSTDILFLSSTDLQSWTSIDLSHRLMSLTTYQSMFVLVGGYHHSTARITNKLLTSTTGHQWEASLPPMPTKRCGTSSVSTRSSPEVLVVAGGLGPNNKHLDLVEALVENKWVTVNPLPEPVSWMQFWATLHEGKICFLNCREKNSTILTCSCTSLISLCSKSTSNSLDRPLWQQFQTPVVGWSTIVSYSSRLVLVDYFGRIRGYSSNAQSWLPVTSTGIPSDRSCNIAATVLNTGELVLAHEYGGIYRGAVSGEREH